MSENAFGRNAEIGVGFSDAALLAVSCFGFVFLIVTVYSLLGLRNSNDGGDDDDETGELSPHSDNYEEKLAAADVSTLNRAQRRARAHHIMKQKRRITPRPGPANENDNDHHGGENDNNARNLIDEDALALVGDIAPAQPQLSRKERSRAAKAAELKERRLLDTERRKQQSGAMAEAKREKRIREQSKARKLEEAVRLQKEKKKERQLQEEIEWKTFLCTPTRTLLVTDWIAEMKQNRTVNCRDLAKSFGLLSSSEEEAVVNRVQELIREGRVAGVLEPSSWRHDSESDGAVRFVYFSDDELLKISSAVMNHHSRRSFSYGGGGKMKDISTATIPLASITKICQEVASASPSGG